MQNLVLKSDVLQWVFCYVLQPSRIEFSKLSSCEVRRLNKLRASCRKIISSIEMVCILLFALFSEPKKGFCLQISAREPNLNSLQ